MNELENLYNEYERTRPFAPYFTTAKYGFEWTPASGCIFYPDNYISRSRSELLGRINPEIPCIICSESEKDSAFQKAVTTLPDALLILCGNRDWAEKEIPRIAALLPLTILDRVITHRQLGDFLPYGDRTTRWFDVIRKSSLPASKKARSKVANAYGLFEDNLSRATFLAILRRYLLSSDAMIPCLDMSEQYFSPLYTHLSDEIFIDCGGFIGDTLEQYINIKPDCDFKEYVIFEPDKDNFAVLEKFITSLKPEVQHKITPYKLGVSREKTSYRMVSGEGSNSYIGEDGDTEINCIAMDDLFTEKRTTFIKMDLQGHEAFALLGAKRLITSYHPVLAISVYHFVQDLWELPLLIQHLNPSYKFFLRAYRPEEEYICYAVPSVRLPK